MKFADRTALTRLQLQGLVYATAQVESGKRQQASAWFGRYWTDFDQYHALPLIAPADVRAQPVAAGAADEHYAIAVGLQANEAEHVVGAVAYPIPRKKSGTAIKRRRQRRAGARTQSEDKYEKRAQPSHRISISEKPLVFILPLNQAGSGTLLDIDDARDT